MYSLVLERLSVEPFAVVGHRGAAGLAPENTLRALEEALKWGADIVEFDVQSTSDGVLIASHDPVVRGDDGVVVDVRRSPYSVVAAVRVGGEPLPRVEELLEAARGRVAVFLEVKEPSDTGRLLKLVESTNAESYVAIISFHDTVVEHVRRASPRLPTGLIYSKPPGRIVEAKKLGCRIVLPRYSLATEKAVALAHRLGLKTVAWTVNTREWIRRLALRGVDGIATDRPDIAAEERKAMRQKPP